MTNRNKPDEKDIVALLKQSSEPAFRQLFDIWFKKLYHFSFRYLKNREHAEEIVQDVLLNLWLNRETIDDKYPVGLYDGTDVFFTAGFFSS